jgi:hypothetical protein
MVLGRKYEKERKKNAENTLRRTKRKERDIYYIIRVVYARQ